MKTLKFLFWAAIWTVIEFVFAMSLLGTTPDMFPKEFNYCIVAIGISSGLFFTKFYHSTK